MTQIAVPWVGMSPVTASSWSHLYHLPRLVSPKEHVPNSQSRKRRVHSSDFKRKVVEYARQLPDKARIKPTCRKYQAHGITPVQVRKWLRGAGSTSPYSSVGESDEFAGSEDGNGMVGRASVCLLSLTRSAWESIVHVQPYVTRQRRHSGRRWRVIKSVRPNTLHIL